MTDLLLHGERPEIPELVLIIRYERPISAADLGELFSALAADYGRVNRGRTLVIANLETESIIARLQEAYATVAPYLHTVWELASAAKNIKEFVETLRDLLGKARDDPQKIRLFQRRKSPPGIKSVEAMVKAAINGGGELELYHKQRGEEISVRVTSSEAIRIREQAKASARELSPPSGRRYVESDTLLGEEKARYIADRFVAAGPDAEALIVAVASALEEAGMGHVLETVAAKLDERGRHSLATAVRASSHQRNRGSEPPELA